MSQKCECFDPCEIRKKCTSQMSDHRTTNAMLFHSFTSFFVWTNTCQGCDGRRRTWWTLGERPSEMDNSPRRRACLCGQTPSRRWRMFRLEMQLVKGLNGFIYRVRTGGQIQFGVKHGHFWFVVAEGPPALERGLTSEWECLSIRCEMTRTITNISSNCNNARLGLLGLKHNVASRRFWRCFLDEARPMDS